VPGPRLDRRHAAGRRVRRPGRLPTRADRRGRRHLPGVPAAGTLASVPLFAASVIAFGVGIGSLDCVINVQAIIVERGSGRAMMSGFHALYSLGGFTGAGAVSVLIALNVALPGVTVAAAALMALATAASAPGLLSRKADDHAAPLVVRAASCC